MLAGDYAMGGHRRRQVKSGFYSRQRNIYTLFSFTVVSVFVVYIISCLTILDIFLVLESDGCEILNIDFFIRPKWITDSSKTGSDLLQFRFSGHLNPFVLNQKLFKSLYMN